MSHFIVKTDIRDSVFCVGERRGYVRLLEVGDDVSRDDIKEPNNDKEKGIIVVTKKWNDLYLGKTKRAEFNRMTVEAEELCKRLNTENVEK